MRLGRDQNLAAQVAALLFRRQLVLEVNAGRARLDEGLHDLEAVQRPAETGFRVGDDGNEPIALGPALGMLDLIGALQGAVDAAAQFRRGVGRVQRLVGVHGAGRIGVGRDLPARQIDGLQTRADHLHSLVAGHGAQRIDKGLVVQQLPQAVGPALRQRMGDRHRAAQAQDVLRGVGALDAVETAGGRRHQIGEGGHGQTRSLKGAAATAVSETRTRTGQN